MALEKRNLKQLGTLVAIHYTEGGPTTIPENPRDFNLMISLLRPSHLQGKYIALPEDWQIPDNWQSFNHSNSPYVFLKSAGDKYTGEAEEPMFITRYGYQAGKDFYQAVYEDGHVEVLSFDDAVELWKKAGVWTEEK